MTLWGGGSSKGVFGVQTKEVCVGRRRMVDADHNQFAVGTS